MSKMSRRRWKYLVVPGLVALCASAFWGMRNVAPLSGKPNQFSVVYTTDTNGFLQACGCSRGQIGSLAKRATLIKKLASPATSAAVLLDGGNLAADLDRSEAVLESLTLLRYNVIGLGKLERDLGSQLMDRLARRKVPVIAWPTMPGRQPEELREYLLIDTYGVGVVSVSSLSAEKAGLVELLRTIRPQANWVVVLSQLTFEEEQDLVRDPAMEGLVNLVIGMRGAPKRELTFLDGTAFVPATKTGEVGVVEVSWEKGAPTVSHRFELVSEKLEPDRAVQEAVSAYYARESRRLLEKSLVDKVDWRQAHYEASNRCAECHPAEAQAWVSSKHHRAVDTLKEKQRLVGECLACHSEWFRRTKVFDQRQELAWQGVECASCHGDGVLHSAVRGKDTIQRNVSEATCRGCHNAENDPHFDYPKYLAKIRHWK